MAKINNTKTSKTSTKIAKTNPVSGKHTVLMAAMTKSLSDGRLMAFMNDATEATRDAILAAATKNLNLLMAGKSLPKSEKAKTEKKMTKKEVFAALDRRANKVAKGLGLEPVSKKSTKATASAAKPETDKTIRRVEKVVGGFSAAIEKLRIKFSNDEGDFDTFKKSVRRHVKNAGGEFVSMNKNFSITMGYKGSKYRVRFMKAGPVVKSLGEMN